ncbi:MAG: orotate phosphoribosyltransferase-like protein [Euryarchaeota archaeon]|jgi:orotate phosphoribosyltransferase|nr:orotate phosphoribosyltransferase-like protein [Euryarchaeota archaeon]
MALSVDELRAKVLQLREEGLNDKQIADEMSISKSTITWLQGTSAPEGKPDDVRIGWRTIGVRPQRIDAIGTIMADIVDEQFPEGIDTIVGISLNGILFANSVADQIGAEISIFRSAIGENGGALSHKYANVGGRKVAIVDDLLNSGETMRGAIQALQNDGAEVVICLVLVNKTENNEISGVPLRGLIRAISV